MTYERGLQEVGDGLYAYLQPDGGWGWSNAGLVVDGEHTLLIDTLFDRRLTQEMLREMRAAVPQSARIGTLVNTHGDADHCYGNQLVGGARIVASERAAAEMAEMAPAALASLVEQAPNMGALGEFFLSCFGSFDFEGIELALPQHTFNGELTLHVGSRELRLLEVGPAHTAGDTLVHVPAQGVLYSGDILFAGRHPIVWAGPVSNWIAACERILALDVDVIVPGHGPTSGPDAVRDLKSYFEYLYERARELLGWGLGPLEAARAIAAERFNDWGNPERLVVNVASIYGELEGKQEPVNRVWAFEQMTQLAARG
jgi:glyoxylase-like metal-dependent hydrolase (beta-lactamase superfamily II)